MLKVNNLSLGKKEYGKHSSDENFRMENISFELGDGYIMALLGKNGAGKTTLFDLLSGNARKGSGSVVYDGVELTWRTRSAINAKMAYVGPFHWCSENETVNVNVEVLGALYESFDREYLKQTMERFEFPKSCYEKKYIELSTGQKMQFAIAFALACRPKILLLDEPFANLDPIVCMDIADILQNSVRTEGIIVIVSTHQVEEIGDMADYIGILENGRMIRFGNREEVKSEWM